MIDQPKHIGLTDAINDGYGSLSFRNVKVINRILQCKTGTLGGHVFECDNCSHRFISYNSCRDRHCPRCQSPARVSGVQSRMDELLPVHHFHVVFTVPHQLNPVALRKDTRRLGGIVGGISVPTPGART